MLESAPNVRDRAIVAILLFTGVRCKELVNLNISDLNLATRMLYVKAPEGDIVKNYFERKAVLTKEGAAILKDWMDIRPQQDGQQALFLNTFGQRLTRSGIHKIVANTAKAAGITDKHVFPHLLRHTTATSMLKSGIPITEVAMQLGHRNLSSTMVYLPGDLAGLKESVDARFVY